MLWRSCIGPPSQPKLALSLPIKGPSFCRLTVVGGIAACRQRKPNNLASLMEMHPYSPAGTSPKGKRVTGFSVALRLPTNPVPLPPRRGKSALLPASELISTSMHSTAKSSTPEEKVVPKVPKGVHFHRPPGRFACFPPRCRRGFKGFTCCREAAYNTPSEPARSAG